MIDTTTSQEQSLAVEQAPPNIPQETNPPRRRSPASIVLGVVLGVVVILLAATSALAYAITYQQFSFGQPQLEKSIQYTVLRLPFTPKTPEFLLESMAEAQQKVSKHSFDLSIATQSNTIASSLGLQNFDIQVQGNVDYSDMNNLKTSLDAAVSNQYHLLVRKKDPVVYMKIDKVPQFVFLFLGLTPEQSEKFLTQWISYDTTPLNTEARKYLDENKKETKSSEETVQQIKEILTEPAILAKFQQSQEMLDTYQTYKLHFEADPATIDYLGEKLKKELAKDTTSSMLYTQDEDKKLSDTIKSLTIDVWIDKQSYYMRKVVSAVEVQQSSYAGSAYIPESQKDESQSTAQFAFALKLDKFGEDFNVETPDQSVTFDELVKQIQTQSLQRTP